MRMPKPYLPLAMIFAGLAICTSFAAPVTDSNMTVPVVGHLSEAIQMHGSAVLKQRLYVFGGNSDRGWLNDVHSAPVAAAGEIGEWAREVNLPERRAYLMNAVEVINDCIYLGPGFAAAEQSTPEDQIRWTNDVLWARVNTKGHIESWNRSLPLPAPFRTLVATCSSKKFLVVTGGHAPPLDVLNHIVVAPVAEDGSLGPWKVAGVMPVPLRFHSAVVLDDRLYIWGGQQEIGAGQTSKDVYSTSLRPDGSVGAWKKEAEMPRPVYSATAAGLNDYLLSIGGRYVNGHPTNVIWSAHLREGAVTDWQMIGTDLQARVYHSLALDRLRGTVYINGGKRITSHVDKEGTILTHVQAFRLPQPKSATLLLPDVLAAKHLNFHTDMSRAIVESIKSGKRILTYFYSPNVPASRRFWDQVILSPEFKALAGQQILLALDVTSPYGQEIGKDMGVSRVPAVAILNSEGQVRVQPTWLETLEELVVFLRQ